MYAFARWVYGRLQARLLFSVQQGIRNCGNPAQAAGGRDARTDQEQRGGADGSGDGPVGGRAAPLAGNAARERAPEGLARPPSPVGSAAADFAFWQQKHLCPLTGTMGHALLPRRAGRERRGDSQGGRALRPAFFK